MITKAKAARPAAYYLNASTPQSFIALLRQLSEMGVHEPLYTYYLPGTPEVQQALGERMKGIVFLDFPGDKDLSAVSEEFQAVLAEFIGEHGAVRVPFNFRTNYNAVKVLYDGVMAVGDDPTKIKEFLYRYDQPSATGRLRFDEFGDARDVNLILRSYGSSLPH